MKRSITKLGGYVLFLALLLAPILLLTPATWAQTGRLSGKVLDLQGNPYPDVVVTITNKDNGAHFVVKTDKEGVYRQIGLENGIYNVNFKKDNIDYTDQVQVSIGAGDKGTVLNENFQAIAKKSGYDPEAAKKQQEAANKFKEMKTHFDNGVHAIADADATKQQLSTSPPDQKATLQAKLNTDYQTAVTEFEQAQQSAPDKDPNLPTILGNLGMAYDGAGKYPEAVDALQKAVVLKPTPGLYMQLGTDLARVGKLPDAGAACDKAATLDPTNKMEGESCYKNIGIVLSNSGKMKDATEPLQKATQMDPKDADAWYLLGNALTNQIDAKKEGGKDVYIIPPGTLEAYQKYLELQPTGPHAADAKASLESLAQLSGGTATTVVVKKKKP
ncbi:MAG TPA: tetratricopeptide repeat protein [Candidatus Acidoferrales bacterium]|nr:tetratricopeptide repeat protein [Candidatus Acidoferrales bacterium]